MRSSTIRFWSKADMCSAKEQVRFTPDSDRKSGHVPVVVSALPLKQTCAAQLGMSAKGQNLSSCVAHITLKRADRE
jgi:hypothetical protein